MLDCGRDRKRLRELGPWGLNREAEHNHAEAFRPVGIRKATVGNAHTSHPSTRDDGGGASELDTTWAT